MHRSRFARTLTVLALAAGGAVVGCATAQQASANSQTTTSVVLAQSKAQPQMTGVFKGAKVNGGTASVSHQNGRIVLTLSDDFKTPDTPAPHWQVVDSQGNVYLLNRLKIKEDKFNKTITLPSYIKDVAKVQIWCSWAEALLGEAPFNSPVM
jgi:hypothetical protein